MTHADVLVPTLPPAGLLRELTVPPLPDVTEDGQGACERYWNEELETVVTENIPLKVEGLTPLISTGWPACRPTVVVVLTATTVGAPELPGVQVMLLICFVALRPKSTMESTPTPPGVARAQLSLGETAI